MKVNPITIIIGIVINHKYMQKVKNKIIKEAIWIMIIKERETKNRNRNQKEDRGETSKDNISKNRINNSKIKNKATINGISG